MTLKIRVAALLAAVIMLFCSCSFREFFDKSVLDTPDEDNPPEIVSAPEIVTLARYSGEVIDPYTSKSRTNRDIVSLCYGALVRVDSSYDAVPDICSSFEKSERSVTFTLSETAIFSDGSRVTAADCIYSFTRAEAKDSVYSARFDTITGFGQNDTYTFYVNFSSDNIYNINLTNIPVIKAGSDLSSSVPIGSGAYVVNSDEGGIYLTANKHTAEKPLSDRIALLPVSDAETLLYNINYGLIHAAYADLSDGGSSFRGNVELIDFTTNDLVFAVVNRNRDRFYSVDAVKGVNYAVDRSKIVEGVLSSSSRGVWYPFSPDWSVTKAAELSADIYSSTSAHESFLAAGITLSGVERVYDKKPVELVILVNQESLTKTYVADSVAEDLEGMGFSATVRSLKRDEFRAAVLAGDYDIFIAEMTLYPNMDISAILDNDLVFSASPADTEGVNAYSETFLSAVKSFYSGDENMDIRTFMSVFREYLPFIPLYFTGGALAVSRSLKGSFAPGYYDLFTGAETWTVS